MIRITFSHNRLTAYGHADHGPNGQDIVCAGVSALIYALVGSLTKMENIADLVMRPGYVTVSSQMESAAFDIVRCGLAQIAGQYPECVQLF